MIEFINKGGDYKMTLPDLALNPIAFEPDGPQGGKVVLGFTDEENYIKFQQAVTEKGQGGSVKILRQVAHELHIPEVDS